MSDDPRTTKPRASDAGLCGQCTHVRRQKTSRGAVFYRCARADDDARFPRYPPIPVLRCPGYESQRSG